MSVRFWKARGICFLVLLVGQLLSSSSHLRDCLEVNVREEVLAALGVDLVNGSLVTVILDAAEAAELAAPGVERESLSPRRTVGVVGAVLGRSEHVDLELDRNAAEEGGCGRLAQKDLMEPTPVVLARLECESGGEGENLSAQARLDDVKLWEAKVVADLEADLAEAVDGNRRNNLLARADAVRLASTLGGRDDAVGTSRLLQLDVKEMNLTLATLAIPCHQPCGTARAARR